MSTTTRLRPGQTHAWSTEVDEQAWELVTAAQAGDMDAYAQLYQRYYDTVMGYLVNRLEDRHLAEDLASSTFERALRRIDSVSYQGRDVGAWFITIARNLMFDYCKSYQVRRVVPSGDNPPDAIDTDADPVLEVTRGDLRALLDAALDQLGKTQRQVLTMRFLDGLSVDEAAEAIGRTTGATKALQHRACQRMGRLLDPSVVDYLRP